jgi:hypothetical protein
MKSSPPYPGKISLNGPSRRERHHRAFTLVELLGALAVTTLMLAMFSQITGSASAIWSQVKGGVDNFSQARSILDGLQVDLSKAVIRSDLAAFPGNGGTPQLAFYTERAGLDAPSTDRQLQLVSYALQPSTASTTMVLQRSVQQIAWTDSSSISFGNSSTLPGLGGASMDSEEAAQGVLALALDFVAGDGSLSTSFTFGNCQATTVSLAVIADQTNSHLTAAQRSALETKFQSVAATASSTASVESLWQGVLNDASFWQGYPKGAAGDVRIFSRTYWLPVEGAN